MKPKPKSQKQTPPPSPHQPPIIPPHLWRYGRTAPLITPPTTLYGRPLLPQKLTINN